MKKFNIFVLLICFTIPLALNAQFDARKLPGILSPDFIKPELIFGKARVLVKGDVKLDNIKHDIPDKIMSENGFKIVNVSGNQGSQDETWITINPNNPLNMVGSSNNTRYNHGGVGYKMAGYVTKDGGNTWSVTLTPSNINKFISAPQSGGMTNFDPTLAFDTKGKVYLAYGFAQVGSNDAEGDNGVFVNTSTDGGSTWGDPNPVALENQGSADQAFHDRYTMTCDVSPTSPYKDRLYIAWQRFKQSPGVVFSYSADGNNNWSTTTILPGSNFGTQAPMPATGPNGEVYVVWRQAQTGQTTDMMFQRSADGGKSWLSNAKKIMNVGNLGVVNSQSGRNVLADKQNIRISSCPYIAVDNSNGPRRGWVYVVTAGKNETGNPHIMLSVSSDAGNTWSDKKVIDDNSNGTDVFFPAITVDPVTGMVTIFYYSSQNDPNNRGVDGYIAASFDGSNFTVLRLTPATWYISSMGDISYQGAGNFYWGDYSSITSNNATAYPIFWMPNGPNGSYNSVTSYVAFVSALPNPPDNFKFVNKSTEPTKVTLNWTDPVKNKLGGNISDFKIVVFKGDVQIAEVNKGVQTYTDNSAVEGQSFIYKIRTKTSDGLVSDLITITGIAGGSPEPKKPTEISTRIADNGIIVRWKNPAEHIDGSNADDLSKIEIFANASLAKTVNAPSIQAGEFSEALIELTTGKFYQISLVAVGTRNGTDTKSKASDTVFNYAGAPLASLNENFDSQATMIGTYTGGNVKWGLTTKSSKSAPNAMTDSPEGNYTSQSLNYLILAPVVVSGSNPTLSWDHVALIESGDFGVVSVSEDLKTWKDIASFDKNAYPEWSADITTAPWKEAHRTLSSYVGDTIYIRFAISSNFIKNGDGWYVDNVRLDADPNGINELNSTLSGMSLNVAPNPVGNIAEINLHLPNSGDAAIRIFDLLGNKVSEKILGETPAGELTISFDASSLTSGVYFVQVQLNGVVKSSRMIVNK